MDNILIRFALKIFIILGIFVLIGTALIEFVGWVGDGVGDVVDSVGTTVSSWFDDDEVKVGDIKAATVDHVVDGDTVAVKVKKEGTFNVKMADIILPADNYKGNVTDYLNTVIKKGDKIFVEIKDSDENGVVGYIWTKETDKRDTKTMAKYCINSKLLNKGFARMEYSGNYVSIFKEIYDKAREENKGLHINGDAWN